jgi:hypothetical protein
MWHRTVQCHIGQVMFTVWCASDFYSNFCHALFAYCSIVRVSLQSTIALDSRCSAGVPDSPVNYSRGRLEKPESGWFELYGPGTPDTVRWCTVHCPVAHRTVRCAVPQHTLVSFVPLYLIPNLSIYWFMLNLYAPVEHIF